MRINVKIYALGGIDCLISCPFEKTCACHYSAGDYRTEDGFTPELIFGNEGIECLTRDKPINKNITYSYSILPDNVDSLGYGCPVLENGQIVKFDFNRY